MQLKPMLAAGLLGAGLISATVIAAAQGTPVAAIANCDTATGDLDQRELDMLALMNAARATEGRAALIPSPTLNRSSAWKSEDAAKTGLAHTDSLGRDPFVRMKDCGYPRPLGENVGMGTTSAQAIFGAFMASPGHRANILHASGVAVGIGHANGHWTLTFGLIDDSSGSPPPTAAAPTATPTRTATPSPTPTRTPTPQIFRVQIPMVGTGQ
ncbi:MAG: CAP domain-containing protein [Dehalococcoidia bacterium]